LNATFEWQESFFYPYGLKKLFKFHSSMAMVGVLEALDEGEKTKNLLESCVF
jgi:hypothetical protein